ncbi:hypothetical protein GIB67_021384 [Kingdonia uniflora]|uniref:Transmembrane protein n=1 Tax=Kingdonia uniflora TaxID=39325 RepID=A0A7J7MD84_9MAGN|nr:hypothetical protein GIB67_021384 [Kingdonia uniflora]
MRQRHSQGSIWSEDDLEGGTINMIPPRAWTEIIEKALWVFSVVFIVYYGDKDHNFIHLLWGDDRIRRTPLHLGMVAFLFDAVFLFYTNLLALVKTNSDAMWEILTPSCAPFVILFGVFSFCSTVWCPDFLSLQVFDCVMANLGFLDSSSLGIFPYFYLLKYAVGAD